MSPPRPATQILGLNRPSGTVDSIVMSIRGRFFSVIVRRETLESVYPGGLAGFERDAPTDTFVADDHIAAVSFMDGAWADHFVSQLEELGLTSVAGGEFKDIAVMSRWGTTLPCSWLEEGDGHYWLAGTEPYRPESPKISDRGSVDEMERAIAAEEFELHYQPVVDLASRAVIGAEALLRWNTAVGSPVTPSEFIPWAEKNGLIVRLGAWVLREACSQLGSLHDRFPGETPSQIAVNVSPLQLDAAFVATVRSALDEGGIAGDSLILEITESTPIDRVGAAAAVCGQLKDLGVRLVLDNFGSGYASLNPVRTLPLDGLKICRSIVGGLSLDGECEAFVASVVGLAGNLEMDVCAVGVEHEYQAESLRSLGCVRAQGFLFGAPAPLID